MSMEIAGFSYLGYAFMMIISPHSDLVAARILDEPVIVK